MVVMILRPILSGLLFTAILWGGGTAEAANCKLKRAHVQVTVKSHFPEPRYDFTRSRAQIAAMAGERGRATRITNGVTVYVYGPEARVQVMTFPQKRGGACVRLTRVDLRMTFSELDVYVAREYKKGSCQYKTVLAHENQHVAINRKALKKHLPTIRRKLEAAAKRMRPFWVAKADRAAKSASKRIMAALQPAIRALNRETERGHAKIDTDKSYRKLSKRCRSW